MQTTSEQLTEIHQKVQQVTRILELTEARHERTVHRYRMLWLGSIALVVAVLYMALGSGPTAFAQNETQQVNLAAQSQSSAAKRKALIAQLPEEQRQGVEEFQQRVEWVSQYMQTWDEEQAGAVVAPMLSRIAGSMDAVPQMHQEMKTMNSLMKSIPIVAVEMQRMNANISLITANMGVMTHNMDSTMGRMGRWAPW